jgi:ribosome recycling factor
MTKLEELKAAAEAKLDAAWDTYYTELDKIQEEKQNDLL